MGKGDWRRPTQVKESEFDKRWNETFGPKRRIEDVAGSLGIHLDPDGDVGSDTRSEG